MAVAIDLAAAPLSPRLIRAHTITHTDFRVRVSGVSSYGSCARSESSNVSDSSACAHMPYRLFVKSAKIYGAVERINLRRGDE